MFVVAALVVALAACGARTELLTGFDAGAGADGFVAPDRFRPPPVDATPIRPDASVDPPFRCGESRSCESCTPRGGCGWCGATAECTEGSSERPADESCGDNSTWAWVASECAMLPVGGCGSEPDRARAPRGFEVSAAARNCYFACVADPDPLACASRCVVDATGLTGECSSCVSGRASCALMQCFVNCVGDIASGACLSCACTAGCESWFASCSGLPPSC